jgi:hypothetical protein
MDNTTNSTKENKFTLENITKAIEGLSSMFNTAKITIDNVINDIILFSYQDLKKDSTCNPDAIVAMNNLIKGCYEKWGRGLRLICIITKLETHCNVAYDSQKRLMKPFTLETDVRKCPTLLDLQSKKWDMYGKAERVESSIVHSQDVFKTLQKWVNRNNDEDKSKATKMTPNDRKMLKEIVKVFNKYVSTDKNSLSATIH